MPCHVSQGWTTGRRKGPGKKTDRRDRKERKEDRRAGGQEDTKKTRKRGNRTGGNEKPREGMEQTQTRGDLPRRHCLASIHENAISPDAWWGGGEVVRIRVLRGPVPPCAHLIEHGLSISVPPPPLPSSLPVSSSAAPLNRRFPAGKAQQASLRCC